MPAYFAAVLAGQRDLKQIEAHAAVDASATAPLDNTVIEDMLFSAEHTFGSADSVLKPDDLTARRQWQFKLKYPVRVRRALQASQRQREKDDTSSPRWEMVDRPSEMRLSSDHYACQICPRTGGIMTLIDREAGVELVRGDSPFLFNSWVLEEVVSDGGRADLWDDDMHTKESREEYWVVNRARSRARRTALFSYAVPRLEAVYRARTDSHELLRLEMQLQSCDSIRCDIRLSVVDKRIEIEHTVVRPAKFEANALYLAFPLAITDPRFFLHTAGGVFEAGRQQVYGTCMDYYYFNDYLMVGNQAATFYLAALDTPIVQLGALRSGRWTASLGRIPADLYIWATNNHWYTNWRPSQHGRMVFRYALTSQPGPVDRVYGECFARQITGEDKLDALSPVVVEAPNIVIRTIKPAEDGRGTILRLEEVAGAGGKVLLRPRDRMSLRVVEQNIGERTAGWGRRTTLPGHIEFRPYELRTFRILRGDSA